MDNGPSKYQGVTCNGGPLMVLEERLLPFWEGSDELTGGRIVKAESRWGLEVATDYDRARDVADDVATIPDDEGNALVVGGEDTATTWILLENTNDGMLVRWVFADDEIELVETAKKSGSRKFDRRGRIPCREIYFSPFCGNRGAVGKNMAATEIRSPVRAFHDFDCRKNRKSHVTGLSSL